MPHAPVYPCRVAAVSVLRKSRCRDCVAFRIPGRISAHPVKQNRGRGKMNTESTPSFKQEIFDKILIRRRCPGVRIIDRSCGQFRVNPFSHIFIGTDIPSAAQIFQTFQSFRILPAVLQNLIGAFLHVLHIRPCSSAVNNPISFRQVHRTLRQFIQCYSLPDSFFRNKSRKRTEILHTASGRKLFLSQKLFPACIRRFFLCVPGISHLSVRFIRFFCSRIRVLSLFRLCISSGSRFPYPFYNSCPDCGPGFLIKASRNISPAIKQLSRAGRQNHSSAQNSRRNHTSAPL